MRIRFIRTRTLAERGVRKKDAFKFEYKELIENLNECRVFIKMCPLKTNGRKIA